MRAPAQGAINPAYAAAAPLTPTSRTVEKPATSASSEGGYQPSPTRNYGVGWSTYFGQYTLASPVLFQARIRSSYQTVVQRYLKCDEFARPSPLKLNSTIKVKFNQIYISERSMGAGQHCRCHPCRARGRRHGVYEWRCTGRTVAAGTLRGLMTRWATLLNTPILHTC